MASIRAGLMAVGVSNALISAKMKRGRGGGLGLSANKVSKIYKLILQQNMMISGVGAKFLLHIISSFRMDGCP